MLSQRAETYVERCSPEQQRTLMRLFTLRLAHIPAEGAVVRRRAHRDECSAAEWAMAQDLSGPDWRLLVTGEEAGRPTVEVAHEILLRRWNRLAGPEGWLAAQRAFLLWRGRLEQDRKDWQVEADEHRQEGYLLRDLRLDRALDWQAKRGDNLAAEDRAFIRASLALREREHDARERDRAARERLHWRITLASLAALVMGMLFGVAAWLWSEADMARNEAARQRNAALRTQSLFLADLSLQQTAAGDATTGILLALAGLPRDMTKPDRLYIEQTEDALYAAVLAQHEKRVLLGHADRVLSAAFPADGQRVVTASGDGTARLWDAASGQELAAFVLRGHTERIPSAGFRADGQRVVTASGDGTARIWRLPPRRAALLACARRMLPRQLTPEQRRQFFLDDAMSEETPARAEPAAPAGDCLADGERAGPAASPRGVAAAPAADTPSAGRR